MEIVYQDDDLAVVVKPSGVVSTDEPGGLPSLVRQALNTQDIRTVHRLDQVVSGLMVVARNARAASELSRQVREDGFGKEYLAVIHGCPTEDSGRLQDLLWRDKARRMTFIVQEPGKDVQEALLDYQVLKQTRDLTRVQIRLITGRTHQIRVQFSGRGMPLVGERKYAVLEDACPIALWSYRLEFTHPSTKERLVFSLEPPKIFPWDVC